MNELIEKVVFYLKKRKVEYDFIFFEKEKKYKISNSIKENNAIKFMWKKDSVNKLILDLTNAGLSLELYTNKKDITDITIYKIKDVNYYLIIILAINSHVQLPQLLLKNYRTDNDLYYLDIKLKKILKKSVKKYNAKFGYYSISFENYLNKNYEKLIDNIIKTIKPFINQEVSTVTIDNLTLKINKLFLMAIARNPKYVKEVNDVSTSAQLFENGYSTEDILVLGESIQNNFIRGYKPILIVNYTKRNLVTLKSLISNISIDGGNKCMVMLLHPKFAIALIPIKYYEEIIKKEGNQTYFRLDEEKDLIEMNKQIYYNGKLNNEDIIGIKIDLEELIK